MAVKKKPIPRVCSTQPLLPTALPARQTWVERAWIAATVALLSASIWTLYAPAVNVPFIFDDSDSVIKNTSIVKLFPLIGDAQHPGPLNPPGDLPTSGRPLVNLSLALNYYFGQFQPAWYHLFNILVHTLSALCLSAIIRRTLCLDCFGGKFNRAAWPLALGIALVWAVHPLNTETVVEVTQRSELMAGFFYLATLYGSLRYWQANSVWRRNLWLSLVILCCWAGMACKEIMATAPIMVLLFDRTFIAGTFCRAWRQSRPLYIGMFLSWGFLFYLNANGPRSESAGFNLGVPAYIWWFTQAQVLLIYLKLVFWPWPLTIHYHIPYLTFLGAWPYVLVVALLSLGFGILLWLRNWLGYLGAWVLIILSPTLVVPIVTEVAAERRMYLPLAALVAMVVLGVFILFQRRALQADAHRKQQRGITFSAVAIMMPVSALALFLAFVGRQRLAEYKDDITLWQVTVDRQPDDYLAHAALGGAFSSVHRYADAIEQFQQSIQLQPAYAKAHNHLGEAFSLLNRREEAIQQFQIALRLKPKYAEAHNNLAIEYAQSGEYADALQQFAETLRYRPDSPQVYANMAIAYSQMNDPDKALQEAALALEHGRRLDQTKFLQKFEAWLANYQSTLQKFSTPPGNSSQIPSQTLPER
ncbi:MAG TPA: tetratricopeptide repeat protein [Pirellulales bacterium]|nr:tetratricopeptide repeat protein [Pirellulales bacterium]